MNVQSLFLLVLNLVSINCNSVKYYKMQNANEETIEGIAQNAKAGAVVLTDNKSTYYIDGLDYWKNKYLNKRVSVTGIVKENFKNELTDSLLYSQSVPVKKTVCNASYKLIKH